MDLDLVPADPSGTDPSSDAVHAFKSVSRDRRRDAILAVAREVFFEQGYAAASMSSIAVKLGGSKGTLYNYFKNKEELFTAHVEDRCRRFGDEVFAEWRPERPLRDSLIHLAERYLHFMMNEDAVGTLRLVVAECRRSPHLARIFNEAGPANGRRKLAEKLAIAHDRGAILAPDALTASRHFFGLCKGGLYFDRMLNLVPGPTDDAIRIEAEGVATVFMAAYAAPKALDPAAEGSAKA